MKQRYDEALKDYICSTGELVSVTDVQARADYTLLLTFSTGEKKIYDALPLLNKKIYETLKNKALFINAYVSCGSVAWSDEIDIAPEHLYSNSKNMSEEIIVLEKLNADIDTIQNELKSIWECLQKEQERKNDIYASEKSLVFNYAWKLKELYKNYVTIDFERVMFKEFQNREKEEDKFLDLLAIFKIQGKEYKVGFEFKFPRKSQKSNSSITQNRVSIINNIKRLTWLLQKMDIQLGCFLCATDSNELIYEGRKKVYLDFATYHNHVYRKGSTLPIDGTAGILASNDIEFFWDNVEPTKKNANKYRIKKKGNSEFAWLRPVFIYL